MEIFVSYNVFSDCDDSDSSIVYVGPDREKAIKSVQKKGKGSMTSSCDKYLETWKNGKRVKIEFILHYEGLETRVLRGN